MRLPSIQIGSIWNDSKGREYVVEKYEHNRRVTIRFLDGTNYTTVTTAQSVRDGTVKNKLAPVLYDRGFIGEGSYSYKSHTKFYYFWTNMLCRCYNSEYQKRHPSYEGCQVSEEWYNFQTFASWCDSQFNALYKDFHLDKDILQTGVNKIYSPNTCAFVPREVNSFLVRSTDTTKYQLGVSFHQISGLFAARIRVGNSTRSLGYFKKEEDAAARYLQAKEEKAVYLATKYRDVLTKNVYERLINWKEL